MSMNSDYLNAIGNHGASLITHIALIDGNGDELSGGSYERQPVTWTSASGGNIAFDADVVFTVPGGSTVAGWRGFSAATGGTNYGGPDLVEETFSSEGQYTLSAGDNGINHNVS